MADWHLKDIRHALERSGWRLVAEHPGDGYRISGSWELTRDKRAESILIDFVGFDDMITLPMERSYGCSVRNRRDSQLYFGRMGNKGSQTRERWMGHLKSLIQSL